MTSAKPSSSLGLGFFCKEAGRSELRLVPLALKDAVMVSTGGNSAFPLLQLPEEAPVLREAPLAVSSCPRSSLLQG